MKSSILRCGVALAFVLAAGAACAAEPAPAPADRTAYREQQTARLAQSSDRDSLIAAVLIGAPGERDPRPTAAQGDALKRLAASYANDPLAAYVLATACRQDAACTRRDAYDTLVRVAPGNAIHWLLLPGSAAPDAAQLHAAASAAGADSQLVPLVKIVRAALAGQSGAAADALRREAVAQVPVPFFAPVVVLCKAPPAAQRDDCIALARRLVADGSGGILTRIIGSTMLRRLLGDGAEKTQAIELRRTYVWMSEQVRADDPVVQERLQADVAAHGEWEAWQRETERAAGARTPPAGWAPDNPNLMRLPEERTAAGR